MSLKLGSRDIALTGIFASLYAALSAQPLFPVIGVGGTYFTLAVVIAPLTGLIIGPYRGALAASIGGFVAWSITQFGPLFSLSFVPGAATALCSGYLYESKWKLFSAVYCGLLLVYGFYPVIGPMWLYPFYIWFHLIGVAVLLSLTLLDTINKRIKSSSTLGLGFKVGAISLVATMFGHIVGGILFEAIYLPTFSLDGWRGLWQSLAFLYPLERSLVVFISIIIGTPLIKSLKTHGFEIGGK